MDATALPQAPVGISDGGGSPRFGTYQGCVDVVDLSVLRGAHQLGAAQRLASHKKWLYTFVATREVAALFAVVDVGYASNAFGMAVDLGRRQVLSDVTFLGPPRPLVTVGDHPGTGLDVDFRRPDARFTARRPFGDERYHFRMRHGLSLPFRTAEVEGHFSLLAAGAAPPLTVIAPVDGGIVNVTMKWAGLLSLGSLKTREREYRLDGGVGGFDYTHGYLARQTAWRWAFACGRLSDGTALGINLVEGFNEARDDVNENAVWLGRELHPVGRARFEWNKSDPLDRWHVTTTCGALDLHFTPMAVHREHRDLKLLVSRFSQPLGLWEGTLTLGGRTHKLDALPGVAEDQSVVW